MTDPNAPLRWPSAFSQTARDRWNAMRRSLGRELAQRLFDELSNRPAQSPLQEDAPRSWSLRLAYLLAAGVYLLSAACGLAGLLLLLGPWNGPLKPLAGLILLLLSYAARPRLAEPPDYPLDREQVPVLHALADRIAAALGTPPVAGLAVSADFNASYRTVGWRQRSHVELGAPLLAVLTPEERVALMAHELAHGANGDPLRGQFLQGAVDTLATWASATRPLAIGRLGEGMAFGPLVSLLGLPFEFLMLALSELFLLAAKALLLLVLRQSQRAEYLADRLAARVAGTAAMTGMLEKLYAADAVDAAIRHHALTQPEAPLWPQLVGLVDRLPAAELEGYRQISRSELWQVDSTHPPTAFRVALLAAQALRPSAPLSPLLSDEELAAFEAETAWLLDFKQRELVNRQLEAVYG